MIYELKDKELSTDKRSNFKDTEAGQWYIPYVNTAKEEGTVNGYPDDTFKPGQCVNRAERESRKWLRGEGELISEENAKIMKEVSHN
jgi:hypothetical protein